MAIIKTCELTGKALDWAVAICETGCEPEFFNGSVWITTGGPFTLTGSTVFAPSTNLVQGGQIIEGEKISTTSKTFEWFDCETGWYGHMGDLYAFGETPLIAAMRCYVTSKLGETVEIPDELLEQ